MKHVNFRRSYVHTDTYVDSIRILYGYIEYLCIFTIRGVVYILVGVEIEGGRIIIITKGHPQGQEASGFAQTHPEPCEPETRTVF